jgi:CHC2 zinc finger
MLPGRWDHPRFGREAGRTGAAPFHNDTAPSFCTLPHDPEYKDRCRCFGCGWRGDEADLVRALIPGELWPRRFADLKTSNLMYIHHELVKVAESRKSRFHKPGL